MNDLELANHEAAHALGFIVCTGRVPAEVRIDRPEPDVLGYCRMDLEDAELEPGHLVGILMGPLVGGETIAWRPSKDARTKDEQAAALLVEYFGLGEREYEAALDRGRALLAAAEIRPMLALLARGLSLCPVMDQRQITELLEPYLHKHINPERIGVAA